MGDSPLTLEQLAAVEPLLSDEERMIRDTVRRLVRERFLPRAGELFENEEFPLDLVPQLAEMGLLGASLTGYGCAGMSAVAYGLALGELEYGDSGLRSFVSVQGSLAMYPIWRYGSEEQKQRWLPGMARGELIGCFGLSEPDAGSDPGAMTTRARSDGDDYVLSGTKMWITNAPLAHVGVVWAKVDDGGPESIKGFVVERGMKGLETPKIKGKMSLRASVTGEIVLDGCRVPKGNVLEGARGLSGPLSCLNQARFGISFAVLGAARACYEAALSYARSRVVFGKPIAARQLIQHKLVEMAQEIVKGEIMALHFARLKDLGRITPQQVSLCKRNNVAVALSVAREARSILGGNGILLDYPAIRHALNLESVYTYEGTHEVHTLILGKALTAMDAFLPPARCATLPLPTMKMRLRAALAGSLAATALLYACERPSDGDIMADYEVIPSASAPVAMPLVYAPPSASSAHPPASASGSASSEPAASGSASGAAAPAKPARVWDCGDKGKPDCPMQKWMKSVAGGAVASGDTERLARAFQTMAGRAPGGMGGWAGICAVGIAKAQAGDFDGSKAQCKSCHAKYQRSYHNSRRDEKWP
jgi:glutaryl-CoA dehydrogenase